MSACLCKKHFREVANVFNKETALAYELDDKHCVICAKVIFVEGARRYVQTVRHPQADASLQVPDAFAQLRA